MEKEKEKEQKLQITYKAPKIHIHDLKIMVNCKNFSFYLVFLSRSDILLM